MTVEYMDASSKVLGCYKMTFSVGPVAPTPASLA